MGVYDLVGVGNSYYKIEKIISNFVVDKHPVKKESYSMRLAYLSFLCAALRFGRRNEKQIIDILRIYHLAFDIKENDYNDLMNIEFEDGIDHLHTLLLFLGFSEPLRRKKFIESSCSNLLLGEMLLFDLDNSNEFDNNIFVRLYADYLKVPITYEEEIKELLIRIVSNEDIKGWFKPKRMRPLKYFLNGMKEYQRQQQIDPTHVAVIATMSSGKSTLLNALIGKKVFPSGNKACTSKQLQFANYPKLSRDIGIVLEGYPDSRWNVSYDDIAHWNLDSRINRIEVDGQMNPYSLLKKMNVTFSDTPGTNNSRDRQHGAITQEILKQRNSNVILYVLNATNLASDDDRNLLRKVIKELGNQNIIFVLNKIDQLDLDADDNITDSLNIARDYVMEHGIKSPTIIPISSYAAGLFRYILDGRVLTNKETRDALTLLELFQIPEYDMNRYVDKALVKSLPQSAVFIRKHKNLQLNHEHIHSKAIHEAIKRTGIHMLERLLLNSIPHNGR